MTVAARNRRAWRGALAIAAAWLLAVSVLAGQAGSAQAFEIEFQGRGVKRTLLALFDSKEEAQPHATRLHKLAEMPLNHLGFHLVYHDVNRPLPETRALAAYRGIVSWFVTPLVAPAAYLDWLDGATALGLRYVMLGEIAPRESDELLPKVNRILGRLGLRYPGNFVELTHHAKVVSLDEDMIGFEQKIDKVIPGFPVVVLKAQTARGHIVVETPTALGPLQSTPVATSDGGGFAAQNYTIALDPNTDRLGWIINPFHFFRLALGDERFPIPDVTTLSGRRIYFSHIDGDGWNNQTEVEGYRDTRMLSAEVILKDAIEPYPDLPVSVGLIAGDVQPLLGGVPAAARIARRLFAMNQVEVASHTHTHPYNWQFFETYDRRAEEAMVRNYRPPAQPLRERVTAALMRAAGREYRNSRYDPFIAGTDDLPRTYLREPFDLEREVAGALALSQALAPEGKKAMLYQWSGDTTPYPAAVAATRRAGVRNLNGGDSRLDREYPSVAYVPAIGRPVAGERQIYAVNSNENTYTNDWTGPFGGQMMLEHTLRNTDAPRRLKGFNLYYHMYSGEKPAALRAVRHFLELARTAPVIPIAASSYAAMADDWYGVEVEQVNLFAWAVRNRGAVETMRFDDADQLDLDLANSIAVLGANRHAGSLYVSLDPAVPRAVIALKPRANEAASVAGEPLLSLIEGRWRFSALMQGDCRLTVVAQGFGAGDMVWRTRPGRAFRIRLSRAGTTLTEEVRWADAAGLLALRFPVSAVMPLDLTFVCHE